jgi:hypothetical protein
VQADASSRAVAAAYPTWKRLRAAVPIAVTIQVEQRARQRRIRRINNACLKVWLDCYQPRARSGNPHQFRHRLLGPLHVVEPGRLGNPSSISFGKLSA